MEISTSQSFPAPLSDVVEMMSDQGFWEAVAKRARATEFQINTNPERSQIMLLLDSPAEIAPFVGKTYRLTQTVTWTGGNDDRRTCVVEADVAGYPVKLQANGVLTHDNGETTATYAGSFEVNIPFLGNSIERKAAPHVLEALDKQAEVGREWLAS